MDTGTQSPAALLQILLTAHVANQHVWKCYEEYSLDLPFKKTCPEITLMISHYIKTLLRQNCQFSPIECDITTPVFSPLALMIVGHSKVEPYNLLMCRAKSNQNIALKTFGNGAPLIKQLVNRPE